MPVPSGEPLCRFVQARTKDWSTELNRPKPNAFRDDQGMISVWNVRLLSEYRVPIERLQTGSFSGSGQARLTSEDYFQAAHEVEEASGVSLDVRVEWRPEDQYVKEEWRQWAYAHVQVEHPTDSSVLNLFRRILTTKSRCTVPPDRFKGS